MHGYSNICFHVLKCNHIIVVICIFKILFCYILFYTLTFSYSHSCHQKVMYLSYGHLMNNEICI